MAFTPEPKFPDFTDLMKSLNNSRISITNPALYQTIKGLMDKVQQFKGLSTEEFDQITQNINDLTDIINNISTGNNIILPSPIMPVFDGEDGDDAYPIPGPPGKDGLDGKTIPGMDGQESESDALIPFGPFAQCCGEEASAVTFTTTGTIDDLDFGNVRLIRMNNASVATIRGLKAGRNGQIVIIAAVGTANVDLSHLTGSAAGNQLFNIATSSITSLVAGVGYAIYIYDADSGIWRLVHHEQGEGISQAFDAADFTANGGMTWTVAAGDVGAYRFYLRGKTLSFWMQFDTTSVTAPLSTQLRVEIPNGYTCVNAAQGYMFIINSGAFTSGRWYVGSSTQLFLELSTGGNWAGAVNTTYVALSGQIEVQ